MRVTTVFQLTLADKLSSGLPKARESDALKINAFFVWLSPCIGYAAKCDIPCAITGAPAELMQTSFLALPLADCFT